MRFRTIAVLAGSLILAAATLRSANGAEANCAADPKACAGLAYVALTYPYERLPDSYLYVEGFGSPAGDLAKEAAAGCGS